MALLLQAGKKPCQRRDARDDRAGSKVVFTGDSGEYEGNLSTLEEECAKDKPTAKTVRQLMKATFHGIFAFAYMLGQKKYLYAGLFNDIIYCGHASCMYIYCTVGRRQWILDDSPSVHDVLDKFPSLKKTRYVSLHHYTCILCNDFDTLLYLPVIAPTRTAGDNRNGRLESFRGEVGVF